MNDDFAPFGLAVKLKEKGFDYPCIGHYVNNQLYVAHYQNAFHSDNDESVDAPTISQVLKWLRDTHKLFMSPCVITDYQDDFHRDTTYWSFIIVNVESGDYIYREYERVTEKRYDSYEQAAIAGVNYCLENLI